MERNQHGESLSFQEQLEQRLAERVALAQALLAKSIAQGTPLVDQAHQVRPPAYAADLSRFGYIDGKTFDPSSH